MIGKQDQNTIVDTTGVVVLCQKWQARLNYSKKNHYGIFFVHTSCMVLDLLIVMFYELDIFACLTICQFFKNNCIIIFFFFFYRCCWHKYRDQASHFLFWATLGDVQPPVNVFVFLRRFPVRTSLSVL